MNKTCSFMYDDFSDRLLISCKKPEDKITGSIRFLNTTLDFTGKNKIANIEIKKASDYLKSLEFNPKILEKLTDAKIMFKTCRDGYLVYFILKHGKEVERIPFNIPSKKIPIFS